MLKTRKRGWTGRAGPRRAPTLAETDWLTRHRAANAATGTAQLTSMAVLHGNAHRSTNSSRSPYPTLEFAYAANRPRCSGSLISPTYASTGASRNPMPTPMVTEATCSAATDRAECNRYHEAACGTVTSSMVHFRPSGDCKQPDSTLPTGWHSNSMLPAT